MAIIELNRSPASSAGMTVAHCDLIWLCRYTVVLNSFKRHDLLKAAVKHYGGCPEVDAVRVVWSEDSKGPPSQGEDPTFYAAAGSAEVVYDVQQSPSLNNRFRPLPGLRTLAVLSIDDDIRYALALDF